MSLESRLVKLEGAAAAAPPDAPEDIRCPACGPRLRAPYAVPDDATLRQLPRGEVLRLYDQVMSEPDPHATPCPRCGHRRPDLPNLTGLAPAELMRLYREELTRS